MARNCSSLGFSLFAGGRRWRRLCPGRGFWRGILRRRALGLRGRGWSGFRALWRLTDRQKLPHLVESFWPDSLDGEKIIYAAKRSVRFRSFRILSAVEGPMPATCCNSAELAVFGLTDAAAVSSLHQDPASSGAPRLARGSKWPAAHLYGTPSCFGAISWKLLIQ
jgi:hypothetical protein